MWASCLARGHAPGHAETQLPWCGPREGSAALAQLVERLTRNEKVAGSIPAGGPAENPQCFRYSEGLSQALQGPSS